MVLTILFLFGMISGALFMTGVGALTRRRHARPHHKDPHYAAARYATVTHIRRHGRLTFAVLRGVLDIPDMTIHRYLERMESEGLIRRHGRAEGTFFTRA